MDDALGADDARVEPRQSGREHRLANPRHVSTALAAIGSARDGAGGRHRRTAGPAHRRGGSDRPVGEQPTWLENGGDEHRSFRRAASRPGRTTSAPITPDPPFDAGLSARTCGVSPCRRAISLVRLDRSSERHRPSGRAARWHEGAAAVPPAFDLSRIDGLDGWTAYLRDSTSLRRISSVATLSGTKTHVHSRHARHQPDPADGAAFQR